MKKVFAALSLSIVVIAATALVGVAQADPAADQLCPALDTGHITPAGEPTSLLVTAPPGTEITGWCAKAGSSKQGEGAETHDIANTASVTISHTSGKAISHYSLDLPPPPPPVVPPPVVPPTP